MIRAVVSVALAGLMLRKSATKRVANRLNGDPPNTGYGLSFTFTQDYSLISPRLMLAPRFASTVLLACPGVEISTW